MEMVSEKYFMEVFSVLSPFNSITIGLRDVGISAWVP
jgi:hypothetical protein